MASLFQSKMKVVSFTELFRCVQNEELGSYKVEASYQSILRNSKNLFTTSDKKGNMMYCFDVRISNGDHDVDESLKVKFFTGAGAKVFDLQPSEFHALELNGTEESRFDRIDPSKTYEFSVRVTQNLYKDVKSIEIICDNVVCKGDVVVLQSVMVGSASSSSSSSSSPLPLSEESVSKSVDSKDERDKKKARNK